MLPPQNLIHPVLPAKIRDEKGGEKLMFTLCHTCARECNFALNSCEHDAEERAIEGCWITPEIYKAVELGYKIVRFIEVWHYPLKSKTFFKGYINLWFKKKAEAKGYPAWANDAEINFWKQTVSNLNIIVSKKIRLNMQCPNSFSTLSGVIFVKIPKGKPRQRSLLTPVNFENG